MGIYHITKQQLEIINISLSDILQVSNSNFEFEDLYIATLDTQVPWNKGKEMDQDYRDSHRNHIFTPEQRDKIQKHLDSLRKTMYTEERNAKISKSLRGQKYTQERKDNISRSKKGQKLSEDHRNNISESLKGNTNLKGHKHSVETKAKMSSAVRPPPWNKGLSGYKKKSAAK